jgi:hypothetical protein
VTRRRILIALAVAAFAAVAFVAVSAARGSYEIVPPRVIGGRRAQPPGWSRPCWVFDSPRSSVPFSLRCARVAGTVVYVERHDPDGDGDRHLIVLAGLHLVKVKFPRRVKVALPGIGSTVHLVGSAPAGGSGLPVVIAGARP